MLRQHRDRPKKKSKTRNDGYKYIKQQRAAVLPISSKVTYIRSCGSGERKIFIFAPTESITTPPSTRTRTAKRRRYGFKNKAKTCTKCVTQRACRAQTLSLRRSPSERCRKLFIFGAARTKRGKYSYPQRPRGIDPLRWLRARGCPWPRLSVSTNTKRVRFRFSDFPFSDCTRFPFSCWGSR